jgi:hypothetical protein
MAVEDILLDRVESLEAEVERLKAVVAWLMRERDDLIRALDAALRHIPTRTGV